MGWGRGDRMERPTKQIHHTFVQPLTEKTMHFKGPRLYLKDENNKKLTKLS